MKAKPPTINDFIDANKDEGYLIVAAPCSESSTAAMIDAHNIGLDDMPKNEALDIIATKMIGMAMGILSASSKSMDDDEDEEAPGLGEPLACVVIHEHGNSMHFQEDVDEQPEKIDSIISGILSLKGQVVELAEKNGGVKEVMDSISSMDFEERDGLLSLETSAFVSSRSTSRN
jgi:hypothetical protein